MAVLHVHGAFEDGLDWFTDRSDMDVVAYPVALYEEELDVWVLNLRGSQYSRTHANVAITDAEYWNFSIDECAHIDIPAAIDVIALSVGVVDW